MKPTIILLPLFALLCACRPAPAPTDAVQPASAEPAAAAPAEAAAPASVTDANGVPAFKVYVNLSDRARERLAMPPDTIIVAAYYFGDPIPQALAQANQIGQIDLGRSQVDLRTAGLATFDGSAMEPAKLSLLQGPPQVNINVYSGRRSSADNLLDCDFFQDTLAVAAVSQINLYCKLISETP